MSENIPTGKLTSDTGISSDTSGEPTSGAASSLNKSATGTTSSATSQGKSTLDKGLETVGNKLAGQGGVFGSMGQKMKEMSGHHGMRKEEEGGSKMKPPDQFSK